MVIKLLSAGRRNACEEGPKRLIANRPRPTHENSKQGCHLSRSTRYCCRQWLYCKTFHCINQFANIKHTCEVKLGPERVGDCTMSGWFDYRITEDPIQTNIIMLSFVADKEYISRDIEVHWTPISWNQCFVIAQGCCS